MDWSSGALVYLRQNRALGPIRVVRPSGDKVIVRLLRGEDQTLKISAAELIAFPIYEGLTLTLVPPADAEQEADGPVNHPLARVVSVVRAEGLRQCLVRIEGQGTEQMVDESRLIPIGANGASPLDLLEASEWRSPRRFLARRDLRMKLARLYEDSDGTPTLFGARVWPMGHQLYAAQRVLWDRVPRFILADEVGLGKTIEAGYVIQALCASDLTLRVLVVAPGAMTRQWLCELYLRFGARVFTEISTAKWDASKAETRAQLVMSPRLIVSMTAVASSPELRKALSNEDFGLVIIDEAHQFPPSHSLYPWLQQLSQRAHGLLALSATPSKRDTESLLGLLALVSPSVYDPRDASALDQRLASKKRIWIALANSHELMDSYRRTGAEPDDELFQDIANEWEGVISDDATCASILEGVRGGDIDALDELIGYVQEFHRIDHRLIRTRRVTLDALGASRNSREYEILDYEASSGEVLLAEHLERLSAAEELDSEQWALRGMYQRFAATMPEHFLRLLRERLATVARPGKPPEVSPAASLRSDPGPEDEVILIKWLVNTAKPLPGEAEWLKAAIGLTEEWKLGGAVCARLSAAAEWIRVRLAEDPSRKVLVFSQETPVVEAFTNHLRAVVPTAGAQMFHHRMKALELEDVALKFQRDNKYRVLVSDELGGEGRNFEIAWAVLHLDTPASVARVEQRIGRLDRMGRAKDRPVRSVVMRGQGAGERAVVRVHQEVFCVYERSIGGLEFALPRLQATIYEIANGKASERAEGELKAEVDLLLRKTDEEFELSLDTSRSLLEKAREVAEMIGETDPGEFASELSAWAKSLGIEASSPEGMVRLKWEAAQLEVPLDTLGNDPDSLFRYAGTFDRQMAMKNDSLQFFGPGHRLFDVLIDALDATPVGRATVFLRNLGTKFRNKMFLVVLAQCTLRAPSVPGGLLVRAQRHSWPVSVEAVFALHPGGEPMAEVVQDADLRKRLLAPYQGGKYDVKVEPGDLASQTGLRPIWEAVRQTIPVALESIDAERADLRDEAAETLTEEFRHEMGYLRSVAARGNTAEAAQAREEIQVREELIAAVRKGAVELEGLAVVIGS